MHVQAERARSQVADRDSKINTADECFRGLDDAHRAAEAENAALKACKVRQSPMTALHLAYISCLIVDALVLVDLME